MNVTYGVVLAATQGVVPTAMQLLSVALIWGRHWMVRWYVRRAIDHFRWNHPETLERLGVAHDDPLLSPYEPTIKGLIRDGSAAVGRDDFYLDQRCAEARRAYILSKAMVAAGIVVFLGSAYFEVS